MATNVFTILNHGTRFHRDNHDELIAELGRALTGTEARVQNDGGKTRFQDGDFLINEGPGAGEGGVVQGGAPHENMPGRVNPFTGGEKKPVTRLAQQRVWKKAGKAHFRVDETNEVPLGRFGQDFHGVTPTAGYREGNILGKGWDDNIWKTLYVLTQKQDKGSFPDRINIAGWSRGAVTCLRLANAIYQKAEEKLFGKTPEINLFLIDPVVGGATKTGVDMEIIPPNTARVLTILAEHETAAGFSPLSADKMWIASGRTQVTYLPMPGAHGAQVMRMPGFHEGARITWHLCYRFLLSLGTRMSKPALAGSITSAAAMCEAYARLVAKHLRPPRLNGRDFTKHLEEYVQHSEYFVNAHHRQVFRRAFPDIYRAIFAGPGGLSEPMKVRLRTTYPSLYRSLETAGLIQDGAHRKKHANPRKHPFPFAWPTGVPLF